MADEKQEASRPLNLAQRLVAVMGDVGYVQKTGETQSGARFKYVRHDDVVGLVRPALVKHGVFMLSRVRDGSLQVEPVGKTANGAPIWRTSLWMDVTLINADDPADAYAVATPGEGVDSGDKGIGKAMSYATKNGLLKLFLIEAGEDADNEAGQQHEVAAVKAGKRAKPPADEDTDGRLPGLKRFWAAARKEGIAEDTVKAWFKRNLGLDSTKAATPEQLTTALAWAMSYNRLAKELQVVTKAAGAQPDALVKLVEGYGATGLGELTLPEWQALIAWFKELGEENVSFGDDDEEPPGRGPLRDMEQGA